MTNSADDQLTQLDPNADLDVKTVHALRENPDVFLFDVREEWEYENGHIPGILLIPMETVPLRMDEIPKDKNVIVTCRSGNRSGQVAEFLRMQGYAKVHNMLGGILDWEEAGLEVER